MAKSNSNQLRRRVFLKTTLTGVAAITAGLIPGSTRAAESDPKRIAKATERKVELLFLGTGAADWPSKYPPADMKLTRGQVRGTSSMLINGHILIDCGPTVLDVMNRYKVNPAGITDLLLTHTHADHLHPESVRTLADARDAKFGPLRIWAHPEALKRVPTSSRIETFPVEIGKPVMMHGFGMTGLEANHLVRTSKEKCLYYFIEGATKNFLYATDGSWLLKRTWLYLQKKRLDALVWDATIGEGIGDYRIFEHNDLAMIRHMNQTLMNRNILKSDAKIILTHMARTLHPSQDQLEKKLLPEGLIPAYDGMSLVL